MTSPQDFEALVVLVDLIVDGDFTNVRELLRVAPFEKRIVLQALLSYTPPLTPSQELLFLDEWLKLPKSDAVDIPASLTDDPIALQSLDLSPEVLEGRLTAIVDKLNKDDTLYGLDDTTMISFIKSRARKLDASSLLDFEDVLLHSVKKDTQFSQWNSAVLVPLHYLRSITTAEDISLSQFEELKTEERVELILETLRITGTQQLQPQFITYLTSLDRDILLKLIHPVVDHDELILLNQVISLLFSEVEHKDDAISAILEVFYNFNSPDSRILDSIYSTLNVMKMSTANGSVERALHIVKSTMEFPLKYETLGDLEKISNDYKLQLSKFESITDSASRVEMRQLLAHFNLLKQAIFPDLDSTSTKRLILDKLLSLKLYDDLDVEASDEPIIIQHFWDCFKTATNGSKDRGELFNAYQSLKIITPRSNQVEKLLTFVDAVDKLFHYSIYFKRGTPFKPVDLLTVDVRELVQKILELNDGAYTDPDGLHHLLTQLSHGLPESSFPSKEELRCFCIDSSLAHGDFDYAYDLASSTIMSSSEVLQSEHWYTWFQVAKYVSPEWLETEIPESIIEKQLSLLSQVLLICPIQHSQVVITQWKSLDMDLALREETLPVLDNQPQQPQSRSLESRLARALSSTANEIMQEGNGAPIKNLLSNGLGWMKNSIG
ncbi:Sec39p CYBJADRAFT_189054 [Cyberlindnera jadinii NRRL Y-1542]|uniref:Sec39 domain-containing protein n=1 Tax=Cyberlindnera jadinii (strain ATCC 18201 / CBS 1600 / BCRC 20928 / JCM 3617 / NBRC 0987 / NRRL Y-1542) TaxID=983966 RepID=A0A1E4S5V6_CYBJN|nr:hypothetical protein CYBJADRAFT_189054 [Cyberlindnera jadinii NRRL Y-1542]ODV74888.1 hypothetical protein CYBJADRAFT_189054 [Cyberlindnera jadinii NRRL Y-1542]